MAGSTDLDGIQAELDQALEARISDMLGYVRASKELVRGIAQADSELSRIEEQHHRLAGRANEGDAEAEQRVRALDRSAARLIDGRTRLMADLRQVVQALGG